MIANQYQPKILSFCLLIIQTSPPSFALKQPTFLEKLQEVIPFQVRKLFKGGGANKNKTKRLIDM